LQLKNFLFQISFDPFNDGRVVTSSTDGFLRSTDLSSEQIVDIVYKWYTFDNDWSNMSIGYHGFLSAKEMLIGKTKKTSG
jgi:hypothetical protein